MTAETIHWTPSMVDGSTHWTARFPGCVLLTIVHHAGAELRPESFRHHVQFSSGGVTVDLVTNGLASTLPLAQRAARDALREFAGALSDAVVRILMPRPEDL